MRWRWRWPILSPHSIQMLSFWAAQSLRLAKVSASHCASGWRASVARGDPRLTYYPAHLVRARHSLARACYHYIGGTLGGGVIAADEESYSGAKVWPVACGDAIMQYGAGERREAEGGVTEQGSQYARAGSCGRQYRGRLRHAIKRKATCATLRVIR